MTGTLTGRGVLVWLAGFFAVVIAANAWFVTLSVNSFHGEDRQRPYQQGLDYNDTLAARARQRAAGWHAALTLNGSRLRLTVTKLDGKPVEGLKLAGTLRHPADTFRDMPFALTAIAPGIYEGTVGEAGHGRRDAVVRTVAGEPFEVERRVWLP